MQGIRGIAAQHVLTDGFQVHGVLFTKVVLKLLLGAEIIFPYAAFKGTENARPQFATIRRSQGSTGWNGWVRTQAVGSQVLRSAATRERMGP